MKERRFYVPEDFEITMEKMTKILVREGKSLSEWVREQIRNYVRLHEPGNPQQLLERFQDGKGPYIARECCFNGCYRKAGWVGMYNGLRKYVCGRHQKRARKSENWVGWRRLKP